MPHKTNFTELTTPRLILRELAMSDLAAFRKFTEDPLAMRFYPHLAKGADPARDWITAQMNRYARDGFGLWALIDKHSDQYVGQCGLLIQVVDEIEELEIGYNLLTAYRGNGYATEAAIACREYGFAHNLAPSIISIIHVDNVDSQKVAMRNGMQREKQTIFKGNPVFIYRV